MTRADLSSILEKLNGKGMANGEFVRAFSEWSGLDSISDALASGEPIEPARVREVLCAIATVFAYLDIGNAAVDLWDHILTESN